MAMELVDSMNGDEIDAILEEMGTSLEAAREGLVVPDDDLDAEEWKEQLRAADDRKMSLEQYLNEANDRALDGVEAMQATQGQMAARLRAYAGERGR
ncbi:unnamed protein product, partial [Prorocentrum cordatum]